MMFSSAPEIRKAIYSTNTIKSLNMTLSEDKTASRIYRINKNNTVGLLRKCNCDSRLLQKKLRFSQQIKVKWIHLDRLTVNLFLALD